MPTSTPLNVSDATVGFALDTITPRSIASTRYVRYHEWLDHLLGNPIPTSKITPFGIEFSSSSEELDAKIKQLEEEVKVLNKQKENGWEFHADETRAQVVSDAIYKLRTDFGQGSVEQIQKEIEDKLNVKIVEEKIIKPVTINYDRRKIEEEQAALARDRQSKEVEDKTVGLDAMMS